MHEQVVTSSPLQEERLAMTKLNHSLMPRLYATYRDAKYVYFLTDYYAGGDFLDLIEVGSLRVGGCSTC